MFDWTNSEFNNFKVKNILFFIFIAFEKIKALKSTKKYRSVVILFVTDMRRALTSARIPFFTKTAFEQTVLT